MVYLLFANVFYMYKNTIVFFLNIFFVFYALVFLIALYAVFHCCLQVSFNAFCNVLTFCKRGLRVCVVRFFESTVICTYNTLHQRNWLMTISIADTNLKN